MKVQVVDAPGYEDFEGESLLAVATPGGLRHVIQCDNGCIHVIHSRHVTQLTS